MNAEFNWWLLIVGLVAGAGLVWLVIADWSRREEDVSEDEIAAESAWIAQTLRDRGENVDPEAAEEILALHRAYLRQTGALDAAEPSDDVLSDDADWSDEPGWAGEAEGDAGFARRSGTAAGAVPFHEDGATEAAIQQPANERRSVRSTPLSPRGGPAPGLESEPPNP